MEYVSKERLKLLLDYFNNSQDSTEISAELNGLTAGLRILIDVECKELPDQQWQTIEEFKANPVDGWCWINLSGLVDMACCWDGVFYFNDTTAGHNHDEIWDIRRITHVMPIKTPEEPK